MENRDRRDRRTVLRMAGIPWEKIALVGADNEDKVRQGGMGDVHKVVW